MQKKFPISYTIKYNPLDIKPYAQYAIQVRITGPGDKLLYINDVRTPVDFKKSTSPMVDAAVIRVGGSSTTDTTNPSNKKKCGPVKCPGKPKQCPYGYQKNLDGCEICKCNDPCNPTGKTKRCGPKEKCSVEKKPDGTFEARCGSSSPKTPDGKKPVKESLKPECNLPKLTGPCRASFPRFHYNSATKRCETFTYGGCQGNKNNFHAKTECEAACVA